MVSIAVGLKASSTLQWEVMLAGATCIDKRETEKEQNIKVYKLLNLIVWLSWTNNNNKDFKKYIPENIK